MRYSHLVSESYVDGPGRRAVLFVQGCPLACPGCFAPDTPVLMDDGTVKPIQDIRVGDHVFTHTGEIHAVTETFARPYTGQMVRITVRRRPGASILCTPDHAFLGSTDKESDSDWIPAHKMSRAYATTPRLLANPNAETQFDLIDLLADADLWISRDGQYVRVGHAGPLPRFLPLTKSLMRLVGYYLAEGYKAVRQIGFAFHIDECEYVEEVRRLAREVFSIEATTRELPKKHSAIVHISNITAASVLMALGGQRADGKRIHPSLMNQPLDLLWNLADTYLKGDGNITDRILRVETISYNLSWQIWTILNRLGMRVSIATGYERKVYGDVQHKPVHFVHTPLPAAQSFLDGQTVVRPVEGDGGEHNLVRSLDQIPNWQGTVYNLEVEGDHSYLVCGLAVHNCQNKHLWPREGGREASPIDLSEQLLTANAEAITISGGEPFEQAGSLAWLLREVRKSAPNCHVIIYTGYTWQELMERASVSGAISTIFRLADVIVDGRFMRDLDNGLMQYRGSANQRPIDVRATWERMGRDGGIEPVVLDWDTPEVIVTGNGALLMPIGLDLLDEPASKTRRCGQTVGG